MKQDSRKTIEQLKKEYRSIPVPPSARERAKQGILQAKEEQGRLSPLRLIRPAAATAAAAMAAVTILANLNPTTARAMEKLPVIGPIAQVVTFRTFTDSQGGFEASLEIPGLKGTGEEAVNRSIEEYASQLIALYEAEVAASQGEGHYSMDSSYDVVTDTKDYLSIRICTTIVMASGTEYVKIFTVDKSTGQVIGLRDLFPGQPHMLSDISGNIRAQMEEQMAADENVVYYLNSDTPEWDFKGLSGDESFYLDPKGQLVIVFDEYQVAPGYMGAVEFTIPSSVTGTL